jgi:molybdopterin-containing oxidoreductase family iron-sulfur binding subunit
MEKCSMCIQMTATILNAKERREEVIEGEFQTACSMLVLMEQ